MGRMPYQQASRQRRFIPLRIGRGDAGSGAVGDGRTARPLSITRQPLRWVSSCHGWCRKGSTATIRPVRRAGAARRRTSSRAAGARTAGAEQTSAAKTQAASTRGAASAAKWEAGAAAAATGDESRYTAAGGSRPRPPGHFGSYAGGRHSFGAEDQDTAPRPAGCVAWTRSHNRRRACAGGRRDGRRAWRSAAMLRCLGDQRRCRGGSADEAVGRGPAPPDVPEQVQYPSEQLTFHSPSANISRIYSFPGIRSVLDPSSKNCPSLRNMATSWVPSTDVA